MKDSNTKQTHGTTSRWQGRRFEREGDVILLAWSEMQKGVLALEMFIQEAKHDRRIYNAGQKAWVLAAF